MLTTALIATLALAQQKATFEWKPEKGTSAVYKTINSHKADFGSGPEDLVISWRSTISVSKVEKDKVWLAIDNDEPVATIGGNDAPGIQVQVPDATEEHGLDGKFFPPSDYQGMGFGLYSGFLLPNKALAAGDTYEINGMKATYVGIEKSGEWESHKFTFEYHKDKEASSAWSKGEIWLSTKDLSLVRRKATLNNVDFGMGPETITNEVVRTK